MTTAPQPAVFADRRQLIVYHFMFDPAWDKGFPGGTGFVDALGDLSMLAQRNMTFVLISRAPFGSDFNYDFHVTLDEKVQSVEYNYRAKAARNAPNQEEGEAHGLSVFFLLKGNVHHTYSAYARGVESLTNAYSLLDVTPYGRQEDWEKSPPGWPQQPTYG